MKRMLLHFTLLTLVTSSLTAASPFRDGIVETRSRWKAKAHSRQTFDVVQVDRLSDVAGKSAFLVSQGNDRYLILTVSDYAARKMTKMVRNLGTGDYVEMSYNYRSSASNRAEFIAETKREAALGIEDDHELLFQSNRGRYTTRSSQLYTDATRTALAAILSPTFASQLQRLQTDLLAHVDLQLVCRQVITPLTGGACERQSAPIVEGAAPDCSIDAAFGFPCTTGQRARAEHAQVHRSTSTRY